MLFSFEIILIINNKKDEIGNQVCTSLRVLVRPSTRDCVTGHKMYLPTYYAFVANKKHVKKSRMDYKFRRSYFVLLMPPRNDFWRVPFNYVNTEKK